MKYLDENKKKDNGFLEALLSSCKSEIRPERTSKEIETFYEGDEYAAQLENLYDILIKMHLELTDNRGEKSPSDVVLNTNKIISEKQPVNNSDSHEPGESKQWEVVTKPSSTKVAPNKSNSYSSTTSPVDPNTKEVDLINKLDTAIRYGNVSEVQEIISKVGINQKIGVCNTSESKPWWEAVTKPGYTKVVPNKSNSYSSTTSPVDPNTKEVDLINKLDTAIRYGNVSEVQEIIKSGKIGINQKIGVCNTSSMLEEAIAHNQVEIAKVLIDAGANVHEKFYDGKNLLFKAVGFGGYYNHDKMVELLLPFFKDNINQKDNQNKTVLHYAAFYGSSQVVKNFLEATSVDVSIKDKYNKTPLDYAYGRIQTILLLIKANADINNVGTSFKEYNVKLYDIIKDNIDNIKALNFSQILQLEHTIKVDNGINEFIDVCNITEDLIKGTSISGDGTDDESSSD